MLFSPKNAHMTYFGGKIAIFQKQPAAQEEKRQQLLLILFATINWHYLVTTEFSTGNDTLLIA